MKVVTTVEFDVDLDYLDASSRRHQALDKAVENSFNAIVRELIEWHCRRRRGLEISRIKTDVRKENGEYFSFDSDYQI